MSDDEPNTGGGGPKAGVSILGSGSDAPDEPTDATGTRPIGEPTASGAPSKAGVAPPADPGPKK